MKAKDFITLVKEMRDAQKKYFKQRGQANMLASMEIEKRVDRAILEGIDLTGTTEQMDLFAAANTPHTEE